MTTETQTQEERLVGGVGAVRVGDLEITLTPLSQSEETLLRRRLRLASAEHAADNYTRCRDVLDAAKDSPADRSEMLREIARLTVSEGKGKLPLDGAALFDFRLGPHFLPVELFARAKKATPGLTLEGLRAVVTEANADEVAARMLEVIAAGDPK